MVNYLDIECNGKFVGLIEDTAKNREKLALSFSWIAWPPYKTKIDGVSVTKLSLKELSFGTRNA